MKITNEEVRHVADLANLQLSDDECARMVRDLNSILDYADLLNQLDTSGVEPMAQVSDRYGVDNSKTGWERFAYAVRDDILEGLRMVHDKGFWLEVVTLVIPGWNDSDAELTKAARFLQTHQSPQLPTASW